jgi:hypothetical protein
MVGITRTGGRFRARFKWLGEQYDAGTHSTAEEAQAARHALMIKVGRPI